ncbi:serine/threonine-protein phosphatase 6 regulatory subunit 3-like isoform X1 [Phalaenopsis equestris]|uniref:serine/threonine-protein phosphatase 6 regulatory subunit 3-like isoform X1 n=1 Tax=Phalaenopsis equestris TaxID=78828 RepID=UPI0009E2511D|nr:serine/threonine-protein phosphatase 6 regulatory subunit 3-like isoform X1 [Phalaenopsis equestris]
MMFWRMTGLSTASPVDTILDKENYALEELLDEDEIIQECKALNNRLINFLRERAQVEQLIRYIVEEAPEDAEKKRIFKFPFIACEIFTCEVENILRTLVEDEELMDLLFSYLKPDFPHSTLLAGYFSKVVLCLMARKTAQLMTYVQGHQEVFHQLIDLIGITSIMEVLIRLIGADENMYSNYTDSLHWLDDANVLDLIVNKFSSSNLPEVHANTAEVLCAITRYAPPGLAAKICSPSFVGRLLHHAFEDSRPKSVLVHSLSVCISLLDPKKLLPPPYQSFRSQLSRGTMVNANPDTVNAMLENLGDLLKLLDDTASEVVLQTTYGSLNPPLGKHRLKIVEFISVLLTIGNEAAEEELIHLGAIRKVLDLFFEYPYNNFLHHQVDNIIGSCLESKRTLLVDHILRDCDIVAKILEAEKQPILPADSNKPTLAAEGRPPPRVGNIGHLSRMANKLEQAANSSVIIQTHLQENSEWINWHTNVLVKRNAIENVYNWACGRPTSLQDRARDSDDEDFRDRDYDVAALASNLSQAFRYNIYGTDDIEEAHGSVERDDELQDVYFDDESAEVVISSLRLGDDQDSGSLFTNSNWFAFEEDKAVSDPSSASIASPSPNSEDTDEVVVGESLNPIDRTLNRKFPEPGTVFLGNGPIDESMEDAGHSSPTKENDKSPEWVEWREMTDPSDLCCTNSTPNVPNGDIEAKKVNEKDDHNLSVDEGMPSLAQNDITNQEAERSAGPASKAPPVLAEANLEHENPIEEDKLT